jgi:cytochrome c oxidase assembly protein Cox11
MLHVHCFILSTNPLSDHSRRERTILSTNDAEKIATPHAKKNEAGTLSYTMYKN